MRILFVRHGDPDYENDSLTEQGRLEAELLVPRLSKIDVRQYYVSPMGRARLTAEPTLRAVGRQARVLDWMLEFSALLDINQDPVLQKSFPDTPKEEDGRYIKRIVWDIVPGMMAGRREYYEKDGWRNSAVAAASNMEEEYDRVVRGIDGLLAEYGYFRDGDIYRTEKGHTDTIMLFCHYGVTCVMLSHLWNVNPYVLWNGMVMPPTGVTELYSEEREKGKVIFRASRIGDVSHLYAAGVEPSFAGRFCETFERDFERH